MFFYGGLTIRIRLTLDHTDSYVRETDTEYYLATTALLMAAVHSMLIEDFSIFR